MPRRPRRPPRQRCTRRPRRGGRSRWWRRRRTGSPPRGPPPRRRCAPPDPRDSSEGPAASPPKSAKEIAVRNNVIVAYARRIMKDHKIIKIVRLIRFSKGSASAIYGSVAVLSPASLYFFSPSLLRRNRSTPLNVDHGGNNADVKGAFGAAAAKLTLSPPV